LTLIGWTSAAAAAVADALGVEEEEPLLPQAPKNPASENNPINHHNLIESHPR
jgi:hypothetical protein